MGTDNLFHKRKARDRKSLERRKAKNASYDMVLIVCEGGKTEPNYFKELRRYFRLSSVNIEIEGDKCGSSPINVVDRAISKYRESKEYDRVFCVFDKDKHVTYQQALDKIQGVKKINQQHELKVIDSIPCFEFWILLHYEFTTAPFSSSGNRSICDSVIKKLKTHIPEYEKGNKGIANLIMDKLDEAIGNAKRVEDYHKTSGTDLPSTKVHELVEYLKTLNIDDKNRLTK